MSALLTGYARVSTEEQDLTVQRNGLTELGVEVERIYVDHGLTGTNRDRPGLREALAVCRAGDTLVATKLDRLARSLPDAAAGPCASTKARVPESAVITYRPRHGSCDGSPQQATTSDQTRPITAPAGAE